MTSILKLAHKCLVALFPSIITVMLIDAFIVRLPGDTYIIPFLLLIIMYTWIFHTLENKYPYTAPIVTSEERTKRKRIQEENELAHLESEFQYWKMSQQKSYQSVDYFSSYNRLRQLRIKLHSDYSVD